METGFTNELDLRIITDKGFCHALRSHRVLGREGYGFNKRLDLNTHVSLTSERKMISRKNNMQ